jgi:hypothetical protein
VPPHAGYVGHTASVSRRRAVQSLANAALPLHTAVTRFCLAPPSVRSLAADVDGFAMMISQYSKK